MGMLARLHEPRCIHYYLVVLFTRNLGSYPLADEVLLPGKTCLDASQVLYSMQSQLWLHTLDTYSTQPRLQQQCESLSWRTVESSVSIWLDPCVSMSTLAGNACSLACTSKFRKHACPAQTLDASHGLFSRFNRKRNTHKGQVASLRPAKWQIASAAAAAASLERSEASAPGG